MGYRVKRIEDLERKINRLTAENQNLAGEKAFWHREAIKQAAELGEIKIETAKVLNKFGISSEWIGGIAIE